MLLVGALAATWLVLLAFVLVVGTAREVCIYIRARRASKQAGGARSGFEEWRRQ